MLPETALHKIVSSVPDYRGVCDFWVVKEQKSLNFWLIKQNQALYVERSCVFKKLLPEMGIFTKNVDILQCD